MCTKNIICHGGDCIHEVCIHRLTLSEPMNPADWLNLRIGCTKFDKKIETKNDDLSF